MTNMNELIAFRERIVDLNENMSKVLSDQDINPTLRHKKGVELHLRLERLKEEFRSLSDAELSQQGLLSPYLLDVVSTDEIRELLLATVARILSDFFNIPVA